TMPILAVPLVAHALLEGTATREELIAQAESAPVFADDPAAAIDAALSNLSQREVIYDDNTLWTANPDERTVLSFYANSIAHHLSDKKPVAE
ncbi:MAG: hypothetical protein AAFP15_20060, partial [Bacteroidota bacterium]